MKDLNIMMFNSAIWFLDNIVTDLLFFPYKTYFIISKNIFVKICRN